jgi:hypothetical protein
MAMRALLCAVVMSAAASAGAVCTPATINPAAVQAIKPYMSPAAVSGVLGCAPTEIGPVWIWGVPLVDQAGAKIQVAVAFDAAGAISAHYQVIPPVAATANGALRVDPGVWVPGVAVAP